MRRRRAILAALIVVLWATPGSPTALRVAPADTALLFGGIDAEGGIGDWYVSNGVVEAIIDDVGIQSDLTGIVPTGTEPPIQSEINFTGGSLLDLGRVGLNDDQLAQLLTVGGLSTSNFLVYQSISAPDASTIRATGGIAFPPLSVPPNPCLGVVTDYQALASDPFLTVTSTATNGCGVALTGFGGFLDVFVWTLRSTVPFSGGGLPPLGGKGFNHPTLDLASPASAVEFPIFSAGPGVLRPLDGIVDPANGTTCGEVSYGLLGVDLQVDPDGTGPTPPDAATPVDTLLGVSSTLVTALGNGPLPSLAAGASLRYTRRLYVGDRNDARSVANDMIAALAPRLGFATGTISGNVEAADGADVEASIVITRIGRCAGAAGTSCRAAADCGASGPCVDPVPAPPLGIGAAWSHVRTDPSGAFAGVVLPQGDYELLVSAFERDDVTVRPVTIGAGDTAVTIPPLGARGTLAFTVRERAKRRPAIPAKLVVKGVAPTPDPRFHRDLAATLGGVDVLPETFGGTQAGTSGHAAGQSNVVYTATGSGDIQLRPGTYDVYASRGLEYAVQLKRVTVPANGSVSADFRLKRVIKSRGAVSADFHVHSGRSLDTAAALRDRVAAFAAEGVEVMVSTDHDKHLDYGPLIAAFAQESRLRAIVGNEITGSLPNPPAFPAAIGHINAWPMTVAKDTRRDGAIEDEFVAPNFVYSRLRRAGAEVIQYNHPRAGVSGLTTIGLFNNIGCNRCANAIDTACAQDTDCPAAPAPRECTCVGYQPDRPIGMAPNDILGDAGVLGPGSPANPDGLTNLDFDVMELANGAKDIDFLSLLQVRRDWLSLLNQNVFKPVTGVSDSHRISVEHAGWARTFVFGAGDDPAALDVPAFDGQVKAGNMVVSAGPYLEVGARAPGGGKAGLGQLLAAPRGRVLLTIKVLSPAWIPVDEVRVIANGFQVAAFDATTKPRVKPAPENFQKTGGTARFSARLKLPVSSDTYFVVEAGAKLPASAGTLPAPPAIMDIIVPDVVPIAIANPIFVDADGNGTFDPPGLPVMPAVRTAAAKGLWERVRSGLAPLAARIAGEVVAQGAPGEMTGVTKEQKAEAARKGEYFPFYEFKLPPQAVEQARQAHEEAKRRAVDAAPAR